MLRLGKTLQESTYTRFAIRNVEFGFQSFPFFQKRYRGGNKWEYPFAQKFILEELDDCGAMGASVIEVYEHDPQRKYRAYIDDLIYYYHRPTTLNDIHGIGAILLAGAEKVHFQTASLHLTSPAELIFGRT
jgi:hypothetical protein